MKYWLGKIIFLLVIHSTYCYSQRDTIKVKKKSSLTNSLIDSTPKKNFLIVGVDIIGNKRTKRSIVLREMTLKEGDTISEANLQKQIEISRNQVFNTALFVDVRIEIVPKFADIISLRIEVKERWYLFPLPYFKLVDRNFNQWWVTENRSTDRINYGVKFTQYNLSGNNDGLDIWLINGYSRQVNLRYNIPFFDKKLQHGLNVGYSYVTQKELNTATSLNKQVFFKNSDFVRTSNRADITYSYRPDQKWRHYFRVSFIHEKLGDTILSITPNYFPENRTEMQFLDFNYSWRFLNVDYNAYPTKGYTLDGYLYKRGLENSTNYWQIGLGGTYMHPITKKSFYKASLAATAKRAYDNCYYNQRLFGYGDFFLRGMEYYVIDGDAAALAKFSIHKQIFKYTLHTGLKSKAYSEIPFRYYLKIFSDLGYAHSDIPGNSTLNNKLLYTGGIGLDIVSIYDFVFRFEFSFNQVGGQGLYLHNR